MSLSAAKSRLMQARMALENAQNQRYHEFDSVVAAGMKFLEGLPEDEATPVRKQYEDLIVEFNKIPDPAEVTKVEAAKRQLRRAEELLTERQYLMLESAVAPVDKYLENVKNTELKAQVVADLAAFKEKMKNALPKPIESTPPISSTTITPPPVPPRTAVNFDRASGAAPTPIANQSSRTNPTTEAPTSGNSASTTVATDVPIKLSDDDYSKFSRAKGRVVQARSSAESGQSNVDSYLDEAASLLSAVPQNGVGVSALFAEMITIREMAKAARLKEASRKYDGEFGRKFSSLDYYLENGRFDDAKFGLIALKERLEAPDVKNGCPPEAYARFQAGLEQYKLKATNTQKTQYMSRATPKLEELEALVKEDPFAGKEENELYNIGSKMNSLKISIRGLLESVPKVNGEVDPDAAAIEERVKKVEEKITAAEAKWEHNKVIKNLTTNWSRTKNAINGWETESIPAEHRAFHLPDLPKTNRAFTDVNYFLRHPENVGIKNSKKGTPEVDSLFEEAEKILETSSARLNRAMEKVVEDAEKMEISMDERVLSDLRLLPGSIGRSLKDTPYATPLVERATQIIKKWEAHIAAVMKAREELAEKLTKEATSAWPGVVERLQPIVFDGTNVKPGDKILISERYNRAGWDWSGKEYGFAAMVEGTLLAGWFDDRVQEKLEYTWYTQKLSTSDRIPWDLIGVVMGPGTIGERTNKIMRDSHGLEIGKIEEWPPVPCLKLKIIGLHAGPVCVAPEK